MDPPKIPPSQSQPQLPRLSLLDRTKAPNHTFIRPAKLINDGPDVAHFLVSQGYRDIGLFVLQLARALCPRKPDPQTKSQPRIFNLTSPRKDPPSVTRLQQLLKAVDAFIDQTPPEPGPRRFGNVAFRTWYKLLEERVEGLLKEFVAPEVLGDVVKKEEDESKVSIKDGNEAETEPKEPASAIDEVRAYLLGAFGSAQRLDYGTGHELSFLAFLGCLWKLGVFKDGETGVDGQEEGDIERSIALGVFEPYLKVIRRLILTYTLEPAGSHGVWGLDDHSFLPYVLGSAQLTRPVGPGEPLPLEGSVPRAPRPADVLNAEIVGDQRELNMYFSAVGFVNDVKKGPFWEHSPILFDVSGIKDGWGKINKGMIKMFNAEVLSKFPVVQHFPFGSLFSWDVDPDAAIAPQSVHMANQPTASAVPGSMQPPGKGAVPLGGPVGTAAPWANATRMPGPAGPGIPYSRVAPAPSGMTTARPPPGAAAGQGSSRGVGAAGARGTTDAQITVTKAPWARDGG